jgi:hypothetical protein
MQPPVGFFLFKNLLIRSQSAAKSGDKVFCYLRHRQTAEVCNVGCNYHLAL